MQFEMFQFKQSMVQKVVETEKYYVWLDVVQGEPGSPDYPRREAIFEYPGKKLLRFLSAEQKAKLEAMQAELAALEKALPPEYPYLMGLADNGKAENVKLNIRGNPHALGDEIPRGFPAILAGTAGEPAPFTKGSGRLELAEAIVRHPLAARVMANRIWMHHFGRGIVDNPQQLRHDGRASHASGTARVSRQPVRREELVIEGHAPRDHAFGRVPVELRTGRAERDDRSRQQAFLASEFAASRSRGVA